MLYYQLIGLTIAALLNITTSFINPAITWINNSSLNITVGSSVNYYFDIEYNEWYPSSGSVDTAGTGRCDTNIIIGNGTDPMTGFIQYDRTALTRGTNLISYDENVAVTSDMIYFYNVSSFTLTTFFSTDIGELNQPTFTITFTDGLIWDERDESDIYNLVNTMQSNISSIKTYEQLVYSQVLQMALDLGYVEDDINAVTQNIISIDSKMDNIISYLSTINSNINSFSALYNKFKNNNIPLYRLFAFNFFANVTELNSINFDNSTSLSLYSPTFNFNRTTPAIYDIGGQLLTNESYYLIYYAGNNFHGDKLLFTYTHGTPETEYIGNYYYTNGWRLHVWKFTSTNSTTQQRVSPYLDSEYITSLKLCPIYFGPCSALPDELASILDFDKYEDSTNELENAKDDFVNQSEQLIEFENAQNENMQQQLQNINFNFNGSQFNESATFYKRVFTDFVGSTPLFTPLAVILTFCLAMILLGAL